MIFHILSTSRDRSIINHHYSLSLPSKWICHTHIWPEITYVQVWFNYVSKLHFTIRDQEQHGWALFLLPKISVFFGKMCLEHENSPLHGTWEYRGFLGLGEGRTQLSKKMERTGEILEHFLAMCDLSWASTAFLPQPSIHVMPNDPLPFFFLLWHILSQDHLAFWIAKEESSEMPLLLLDSQSSP